MEPREMLKNVMEENRKLREDLAMAKSQRENVREKDVQAEPGANITQGTTTPNPEKASQDDLGKKYQEGELENDKQTEPATNIAAGGTDLNAKTASQDDLSKKQGAEQTVLEHFCEQYEDDMGKVVEILEKLSKRVEALEGEKGQGTAPLVPEKDEEEPQPPLTEKAKLVNAFTETVKTERADKENIGRALSRVLYS